MKTTSRGLAAVRILRRSIIYTFMCDVGAPRHLTMARRLDYQNSTSMDINSAGRYNLSISLLVSPTIAYLSKMNINNCWWVEHLFLRLIGKLLIVERYFSHYDLPFSKVAHQSECTSTINCSSASPVRKPEQYHAAAVKLWIIWSSKMHFYWYYVYKPMRLATVPWNFQT